MMVKTKRLPIPGLLCGMYPERNVPARKKAYPFDLLTLWVNRFTGLETKKAKGFVQKVRLLEQKTAPFNTSKFNADLQTLQLALRKDGFTDSHLALAFALINRTYLSLMDVRLFDTQLIAAYHLLHNRLAEMATGEGKTFAVGLAAATAAISGVPVHVITANDYLASRDMQSLQPLYQALGLSVDAAIHGQEPLRRKKAYASNITYCTAKELVFDYLRDGLHRKKTPFFNDRMTENTSPLLLRGLCMAIVDEADSILIDEARVPLILSQAIHNQQEVGYYTQSLDLAHSLIMTTDFQLKSAAMQAELTESGRQKLEVAASTLPAVWHNRLHREEIICLALAALYLYRCDQHYVVDNQAVCIIDETTGRIAAGRTWSRGLHQLIEIKEGCQPTANLATLAQITYQRFFPRYFRLSGISGTLLESRSELFRTYDLRVCNVPLRSACLRKILPNRLFRNKLELRDALVERISTLQLTKQSVLIGTESVIESELLSNALQVAGIAHNVLNAKNDINEAELIAMAGHAGAVTITTNMAGRGTDIKIDAQVNALGGLHVISCQANASRRIDRQLIGRSARQGDNGRAETWISLNSSLLLRRLPLWQRNLCKKNPSRVPSIIIKAMIVVSQAKEERYQSLLRKRLLEADAALEDNFSFGGMHHD
jgi:preprotein translocase subunit SecA